MRTIILTYPGYQSLPKGLKQLLVASEKFYFEEFKSAAASASTRKPTGANLAQFPATTSFGNLLAFYAGP